MPLLDMILILVVSFFTSIIWCKSKLKRDHRRQLENYYRDLDMEE